MTLFVRSLSVPPSCTPPIETSEFRQAEAWSVTEQSDLHELLQHGNTRQPIRAATLRWD